MLRFLTALAGVCAVATLSACAARGPLEDIWTDAASPWPDRPDEPNDPAPLAPAFASDIGARETPLELVPPDADEEAYVALALARNPAIAEARAEFKAALARVPQVTALEDPMLSIAPVGDMAETAAGEVQVMTGVSQALPWPETLRARGRVAAQEARAARARLEAARLDVARRARVAYWTLFDAARALEVLEESRAILRQAREVAAARYEAGQAAQQDVIRAAVELSDLEREALELRQRLATARARLNALIDRPVDAPLPPPPPAPARAVELRLEPLLRAATRTNPTLERARSEIVAARGRVRLAELARRPDLTVGLSYNLVDDEGLAPMANGDDQWWATFGITLPIWGEKYDAAEREARRELFARIAALRGAGNDLAADLREAIVELQTQERLTTLFADVLIPQARQAVDASLASYRVGGVEFLSVLENWRRLLEYRRLYFRSVAGLETALAEIKALVGRELPREALLPEPPPPVPPTNDPGREPEVEPGPEESAAADAAAEVPS